ncbi:BTAD domain-containing putative transcriptional regulator [Planobispora siamensis]|uniref:Bacterial transcriptional activator domain-containing protein n=1 Tax=Planobispora siamensis TaxID=936338 RepID=A0A8J3SQN9_9ACTN|nr:BTAD domain-containing putative transcriptional regulator [Planobispora siamensis]GIH97137.1 hypothetical protein Psi01_77670 [Planobispora siamensis]
MLLGKVAVPLPELRWPVQVALEGPACGARHDIVAPEGYLVEARLAADLLGRDPRLRWIRPEPHEIEPAGLTRLVAASPPSPGGPVPDPAPAGDAPDAAEAGAALGAARTGGVPGSERADAVRDAPRTGTAVIQPAVGWALDRSARPVVGEELVLLSRLGGAGTGAADLAVGVTAAMEAAGQLGCPLPGESVARLVEVTGGRAAVVDSVLRALRDRDGGALETCLWRAADLNGLIAGICTRLLHGADAVRLHAVVLAARLGYAHGGLPALRPALRDPEREPWWQPLSGGWYRMQPLWATALRAIRVRGDEAFRDRLTRLVGELEGERAYEEAVDLCLGAGAFEIGAALVAETAGELGSGGRPRALGHRLTGVPRAVLARYPVLAELDRETARDAAGQDGGALWNEVRAALMNGRFGAALAAGKRARQLAPEGGRGAPEHLAHALRLARRARWTRSTERRMRLLLRVAEAASLPCDPPSPAEQAASPAWTGETIPYAGPAVTTDGSPPATGSEAAWAGAAAEPVAGPVTGHVAQAPPERTEDDAGGGAGEGDSEGVGEVGGVGGGVGGGVVVRARLLGGLRLTVGGRQVTGWSGHLGRAVLEFLLLRHPKPVRRDTLTDVFWPGVPEASARNRLNAVLYSLRGDLRKVTGSPVVVYEREGYSLAAGLDVRLDTEEFMAGRAEAVRLRQTGDLQGAIGRHEAALALYSGELLEDSPYVTWVMPERERLSAAHLDLTESLAGLYLEAGAYAACADACRRLLVRDPCREAAHRLLMRCYARQNQPHRAAAQYELCRRELDAVLGMTPDPETDRLYEAVLRHRAI